MPGFFRRTVSASLTRSSSNRDFRTLSTLSLIHIFALIVRMVSRNQRAVDEATSWLKRIVITWIVLNSLGFIVAYLQPMIAGGQYTGG